MELISREEAMRLLKEDLDASRSRGDDERADACFLHLVEISNLPTVEERKEGRWIRTGRTNMYGGEELMCPFCGDRVMVQNIEYELYCRQCGALLGDRVMKDEGE